MLATVCNEIKTGIVNQYLTIGLGAILIYYPELGMDDVPSVEEYSRRRYLTMAEVSNREVGGYSLNGYKRYLPRRDEIEIREGGAIVSIKVEPVFEAVNGILGPFTHICLVRNVNTYQAEGLNGNNRGDQQGEVMLVKPVPVRPLERIASRPDIPPGAYGLILESRVSYRTELIMQINSRIFD